MSNSTHTFGTGVEFAGNVDFANNQAFAANAKFDDGQVFAANETYDFTAAGIDFGEAATIAFGAARTFGASADFPTGQVFTDLDHDLSAANIEYGSGSAFSAGEVFGAGADFSSGTQTFNGAATFDDFTEFADSQAFTAAMTFDKYNHFGDATDFSSQSQTFKEGMSFGEGTKFKSGDTLPVGAIPSQGVIMSATECSDTNCVPAAGDVISPGEKFAAGTDPAATYTNVASDDRNFSVDGLGLEMSFSEVTGDGSIKADLVNPASVAGASLSGDTLTMTLGEGGTLESVGNVIELSTGTATISGGITVTLPYIETNLPAGVSESNLSILHYVNSAWQVEDDCTINAGSDTITCNVDSLSPFSVGAGGGSGGGSASYINKPPVLADEVLVSVNSGETIELDLDDSEHISAEVGDTITVRIAMSDDRGSRNISNVSLYTNFGPFSDDMNRYYANYYNASKDVSQSYYTWLKNTDDIAYNHTNTITWAQPDISEVDVKTKAATFTMTFNESMSMSEVVAKAVDSKGQYFRVVLPITIDVSAPLEQQNKEAELAQAALVKEAAMLAIISQWSGYSEVISTDAELLDSMGLDGDKLPHWTKTLGEWVHQEKINLGELVIAIEYMSTII